MRLSLPHFFSSIVLALLLALSLWLPGQHVFAQSEDIVAGLDEVGTESGLSAPDDPRLIVARIIRVGLGVLGMVAVVLVIYAGFVWMTAGGDEEKVRRAKRILINSIVGLLIILSSWAITEFVLNSLLNATGGNGGNSSDDGGGGGGPVLGGGSGSAFEVTAYKPLGAVPIRNIVLQITLSKNVDPSTVSDSTVRVVHAATGNVVEGTRTVSGNRITFKPAAPCPDPNQDRFCFEENTQFDVAVSGLMSTSEVALSCANNLCAASFTSGDIIDTQGPEATITLPDNGEGVSAESLVGVQAIGTDDAQVSVAEFAAGGVVFDSVPAVGQEPTKEAFDSLWDTAGLQVGSTYQISATVFDIAGNSDTDTVSVEIRSVSCFNGVQDGAETGPDCGGDAASADYCGACAGSSCNEDAQCSSGFCVEGICTDLPTIESVSPLDGAPGTHVTISGKGFGAAMGQVGFTTESGGLVFAGAAICGDAWDPDQIVVVVPEGAIDGPLTVITSGNKIDRSDDDNGPFIDDFNVNDVVRPGLCELTPDSGAPTDSVTLRGAGFGASQDSSTVTFGALPAGSYTAWSNDRLTVTSPSTIDGEYKVAVTVNGARSNELAYSLSSSATDAPIISSISPGEGSVGQYLTLSGTNFGAATGTVRFENVETGEFALGDIDFPEQCLDDYWSNQEVVVMVPATLNDRSGSALPEGQYNVSVQTSNGATSNRVLFTVVPGNPTPGLCALEPGSGVAGDEVTLYGSNFGTAVGTVLFSDQKTATVNSWSNGSITVTVPDGTVTGAVTAIDSASTPSNAVRFEVGESDGEVVAAGTLASYAWSFSSGDIPSTPQIVFVCDDAQVSGVPNSRFGTEGACVNSDIFASFTQPMNEATLSSAFRLERCITSGNNNCASTEAVQGVATTTPTTFRFSPVNDLTTSALYRVTFTTVAESLDGAALARDIIWDFTTRTDAAPCVVENVIVNPAEATINALNGTQHFNALPVTGCYVLNNEEYSWKWGVDPSFARINDTIDPECSAGTSSCAVVEALAEGVTPVTAIELASGVQDDGMLTINFSDPYVTHVWPDCVEACTNAEIGASFNTNMNAASVQAAGAVALYQCANELCTTLTPVAGITAICTGASDCSGFRLGEVSLVPRAFYRVVVRGDVESASGVALTRTNYGGDYSWTFRVREDATACAVDRISVSPDEALLSLVGATQPYEVTAYGEADSCSASGQRLVGYEYTWSWADPIADEDIDNNENTRVAAWLDGQLVDSDPTTIAEGCTASCTAAGSIPYAAICGDSILDTGNGEECEDGNVANGDGCSASCLREGGVGPTCGNGSVDRAASGAGEDCDDGNTVNGDGCSVSCLAEGASSILATCGNGDVAHLSLTALDGEECDDGNALRGDGCSSECLSEGSPTLASIGGSVCGNGGAPEAPAENCDDGNTMDGDGCSSACLLEGSSTQYGSVCGDGEVGRGEECEDGNAVSGDGCSFDCLLEGSSAAYASASFCGDGAVGLGELASCELSAAGDGRIDPVQVAYITDEAVFEVERDTQQALATIEVTEPDSGLSTEATLALSCVAENDLQCGDPNVYGVGQGNCCVERPTVHLYPNGNNICRNTTMYGIFSQPIDMSTLQYEVNEGGQEVTKYRFYARLDSSMVCPGDHDVLATEESQHFLARLWSKLEKLFAGRSVRAASGDCVTPIVGYSQTPLADGTYRVNLITNALLVENATYTITVEGDLDVTNDVTEGVLSELGGAVGGFVEQAFTTGSTVCAFDALEVTDTDIASPYYFSTANEEHTFVATAVSYSTGIPQQIQPIDGVYSWNYTNWSSSDAGDIFEVTQLSSEDQAMVRSVGENGSSTVIADAVVDVNTFNIDSPDKVRGSAEVLAFLCENPWPNVNGIPWSDTAASEAQGAVAGAVGFTNFSTMYCRDAGAEGADEDLPAVTVVHPPVSPSASVIKEYLFEVADGSGDAIGVRVASNPNYLSPAAWYKAQGFVGSPQESEVDGFQAVTDGRTTYIAAPNQVDDKADLYPNIYVISYNEGASEETREIYDQMVNYLRFAVNVENGAVCDDDGGECASPREKLRRDMRRLTDMTDLDAAVTKYHAENGVVPTLPSGSFVRSLSASTWESWKTILGGALGNGVQLGVDPLNNYAECGVSGSPFASYNAETCVDQTRGTYVCPADSHAYHYQAVGDAKALLFADLEYTTAEWVNPIETDAADAVSITIGNSPSGVSGFTSAHFCDGAVVFGASTTCGDGVVGETEVCELGDVGGSVIACTTETGAAGTRSQTCNNTCSGFVDDVASACVPASCGNGVIDISTGEQCDDGAKNGAYGFCGRNCSWNTALSCGDGLLAGGEACDCGATAPRARSRAFEASPGTCAAPNGVYNANPNASCAWDCSGPASFCGDGTLDSGEQCDGTDLTWAGKVCALAAAPAFRGQPCTTSAECGGAACGGITLGNFTRDACPVGKTRVRTCNDNPGASCTYNGATDWSLIPCTDIGACGDGVIDPGEECDDGNTDGTDSCTDQCKANVCGDGYVHLGEEQCDEGSQNGQGCDSAYGSTCTACSLSCRYEISSGEFCGDGELNGDEFCDGSAVPHTYFHAGSQTTFGTCSVLGSTITDANTGRLYTCRNLGVCDGVGVGGAGRVFNGQYCVNSAQCGDGTCIKPTCGQTCGSACPFTYASTSLLMTPNQPGADPSSEVLLYSYDSSSTADLPNAADITIPACRAASSLVATVSMDQVELPDTYVVFVTDRSASMSAILDATTGDNRLEVAQDILTSSVETMFDALGTEMHIALVGYSTYAGTGMCSDNAESCSADTDCGGTAICEDQQDFIDDYDEDELISRINAYTYVGSTQTDRGIEEAKELLDSITDTENVRKIAVLLSDGDPNDEAAADAAAEEFKDAGYELYTVALTTETDLIDNMLDWSSNNGASLNASTGLDYAYDGDTAAELQAVYDEVIGSIIGVTVSLISSTDSGLVYSSSAIIEEGQNVRLPWPREFACDENSEQELPIQIVFGGIGQIQIKDVQLQYCAP